MRPFLLLSIRAEPAAADNEHEAFVRFSGLAEQELRRVNLAREALPEVDLSAWSGILLGGGPWNASDPESTKSPAQQRSERAITALLDAVVEADFPFLGACYGIGTVGIHQGGLVDKQWPEPVGPLSIELTDEGLADPVFAGVPRAFAAYGGHKEGMSRLPESATLLATSDACPVQAFRVGRNVYATQFHPELDVEGLALRIETYREYGYFPPDQAQSLIDMARRSVVTEPPKILAAFTERYARA